MSEAPYRLGFDRVAELPGPVSGGETCSCWWMPWRACPSMDNDWQRRTQVGPRGLGVVIGIEVDDVDTAARYRHEAGCELTAGPLDAPWGERYAECVDPYGYAWKLFRPAPGPPGDGLRATHDLWFGRGTPKGPVSDDDSQLQTATSSIRPSVRSPARSGSSTTET